MSKNDLPTVDIKGKEYVLVKDRVLAFRERYPTGLIETDILSLIESEKIVIKAKIYSRCEDQTLLLISTGHSQATVGDGYINKTAALENAETSAVGRALAFLGIGVIESIASADEIHKAKGSKVDIKPVDTSKPPFGPGSEEEQD